MTNDAMLSKAIALLKNNEKEKAKTILKDILSSSPKNDKALFYMAFTTSSNKEALEYLKKSIEINPSNEKAKQIIRKLENKKTIPNTESEISTRQQQSIPTKTCNTCNKHIPNDSNFCPHCGVGVNSNKKRETTHGHFQFTGTGPGLIWLMIWTSIFNIITFGLFFPWAYATIQKWTCENTSIDGRQLTFKGSGIGFFKTWLLIGLFTLITFGLYTPWGCADFYGGQQITPISRESVI